MLLVLNIPDRENFYTGRVFGENISDVKLHIDDGIITGIIHTPDETYHIEVTLFINFNNSHFLKCIKFLS